MKLTFNELYNTNIGLIVKWDYFLQKPFDCHIQKLFDLLFNIQMKVHFE